MLWAGLYHKNFPTNLQEPDNWGTWVHCIIHCSYIYWSLYISFACSIQTPVPIYHTFSLYAFPRSYPTNSILITIMLLFVSSQPVHCRRIWTTGESIRYQEGAKSCLPLRLPRKFDSPLCHWGFFIDIILREAIWAWSWLSLEHKREPGTFPGGKRRPVHRADNMTTFIWWEFSKLGASTFWNPQGLYRDRFTFYSSQNPTKTTQKKASI